MILIVLLITPNILGETNYQEANSIQYQFKELHQADQLVYENLFIQDDTLEFYQESSVIFRNNELINVSLSFIEVDLVIIENNQFTGGAISIVIFQSQNVTIHNNSFDQIRESAINVFDSERSFVTNNSIDLVEFDNNPWAFYVGVNVQRTPNTVIQNNSIVSPLGEGIFLFYSESSLIKSNIIKNTGFTSLAILASSNSDVEANLIENSSNYGRLHPEEGLPTSSAISISTSSNLFINNNSIINSDSTGLELISLSDSLITSNLLEGHETGIFIGLSTNIIISGNMFNLVDTRIIIDQSSSIQNEDEVSDNNSTLYPGDLLSLSIFVFIVISRKLKK